MTAAAKASSFSVRHIPPPPNIVFTAVILVGGRLFSSRRTSPAPSPRPKSAAGYRQKSSPPTRLLFYHTSFPPPLFFFVKPLITDRHEAEAKKAHISIFLCCGTPQPVFYFSDQLINWPIDPSPFSRLSAVLNGRESPVRRR